MLRARAGLLSGAVAQFRLRSSFHVRADALEIFRRRACEWHISTMMLDCDEIAPSRPQLIKALGSLPRIRQECSQFLANVAHGRRWRWAKSSICVQKDTPFTSSSLIEPVLLLTSGGRTRQGVRIPPIFAMRATREEQETRRRSDAVSLRCFGAGGDAV
jgi:hypothetical protein